jgi:transposase
MLSGYEGYVQADGYDIYEKLLGEEPGITLVGCWAHARRKFYEAAQASKKTGAAHEGLKHINALYRIERELRAKDLSDEEFVTERRRRAEPKLEEFKQWLTKKNDTVVPSTLVGTAVRYTLSEWDHLVRYLDIAALTPDNNAAENAIRPFVLGRKNWLFSGSPEGADASCALYSLIETARNNGFNPYAYLHYIFTRLPHIESDEDWWELVPHNLDAETVNQAFLPHVR